MVPEKGCFPNGSGSGSVAQPRLSSVVQVEQNLGSKATGLLTSWIPFRTEGAFWIRDKTSPEFF